MKFRYLIAGIALLSLAACSSMKFSTGKKITKMSTAEIEKKGYRTGNTIIYERDTVAIGEITSYEWECYKGKVIQEISVTLYDPFRSSSTDVMRYLYTRFSRGKIEINFDNSKYTLKADEK